MKRISILVFGIASALTSFVCKAYTYTAVNRSDKDAEFRFKLAGDLTTNYKFNTISVPANSSHSLTIPEWYRAGLCINPKSIEIRFGTNNEFKMPYNEIGNNSTFEYLVKTHKFPDTDNHLQAPKIWPSKGIITFSSLERRVNHYNDGVQKGPLMQCGDRTYEFTYHEIDTYPVVKKYW